jgi:6,7-dimethyl-8-ribityllumazine synthase
MHRGWPTAAWRCLGAIDHRKIEERRCMQKSDKGQSADLGGEGLRIDVVRARFNDAITSKLADVCVAELLELGVEQRNIREVTVPGALEIPIALAALSAEEPDAMIAIGCIIRGETYHFELVANESGAGVTRVSLDHQVPIANAILTVDDEAQAWARVEEKGRDAARVAVEMANLLEALS